MTTVYTGPNGDAAFNTLTFYKALGFLIDYAAVRTSGTWHYTVRVESK